jgi:hypothetical protein
VQNLEQLANPSATLRQLSLIISPEAPAGLVVVNPNGPGYNLLYTLLINDLLGIPVNVNIPDPAGGGVVGRMRIAEDNNPLPRTRFIFNYDYFNGVPMTAGKNTVNRFVFGGEKTFLQDMMSLEIRIPFAATVDPTIIADGVSGSSTEFGDVRLTYKALVLSSGAWNIGTGLGVDFPTASDIKVRSASGPPVLQVKNESVILTPFAAVLFTPDDRFFAQGWTAFPIAANGNAVGIDAGFLPAPVGAGATQIPLGTGTLATVGHLQSQTLVQLDAQLGYWVLRSDDPARLVQGMAPFVEVHYTTTMGGDRANVVTTPNGWTVGNFLDRFDELNLTAGMVTQIRDHVQLSAGLVVPLLNDAHRSIDWQLGLRANIFFGGPRGCGSKNTALADIF